MVARQKLMEICTSIHISLKNKERQDVAAVKQYFGSMNGTIADKSMQEGIKSRAGIMSNSKPISKRNKTKPN